MIKNSIFDWYKFYEVGCFLLEKGEEENLRTAINRFYYASFCFSRDFLIENNIYYNADLKEKLLSGGSDVHRATRDIFKYSKDLNYGRSHKGKKISRKLKDLRDERNRVDYVNERYTSINAVANKCQATSNSIFNLIKDL